MQVFLWLSLAVGAVAIVLPIQTGTERCMALYSKSHEDTIKISLKFPNDPKVRQIYDYTLKIKNLAGDIIKKEHIYGLNWRTEIAVPNQTIYEACIGVFPNETRLANATVRFRGEVLVNYEANTHFLTQLNHFPADYGQIRQDEVNAMRIQVNDLINITRQIVELQRTQRQQENKEFQQKKQEENHVFQWWMIEFLLIGGLGFFQWNRMKRKIQNQRRLL